MVTWGVAALIVDGIGWGGDGSVASDHLLGGSLNGGGGGRSYNASSSEIGTMGAEKNLKKTLDIAFVVSYVGHAMSVRVAGSLYGGRKSRILVAGQRCEDH